MFERLFHLHHAEDGAITLVSRLIDAPFYRVNFEVTTLRPFSYLAFPHILASEKTSKQPSFDGELMASFDAPIRLCSQNLPAYIWQRLKLNTDRRLNIVSRYLSPKEKVLACSVRAQAYTEVS
jgi:hypothetical protein